jgi:cytochrome P450
MDYAGRLTPIPLTPPNTETQGMSAPITDPVSDKAAKVFANPKAYTDEPRLHAALTHLRAHAPVSLVDRRPYRPFWAITKHADVMEIERANNLFLSEPRPLLAPAEADDLAQSLLQAGMGLRTLIHMDDPQHRVVRAIGADWFRPKAMRALKVRVDELAKIYVDKMLEAGTECDFVQEVAKNYPLYVIMSLLGLPESDFGRMLSLTQELFGGPNHQQTPSSSGAPPRKSNSMFCSNSSAISTISPRRGERTRPTTWRRRSPTPASTVRRCRTSTPRPTTSSSPPPATTPPAQPSPAAYTR